MVVDYLAHSVNKIELRNIIEGTSNYPSIQVEDFKIIMNDNKLIYKTIFKNFSFSTKISILLNTQFKLKPTMYTHIKIQ